VTDKIVVAGRELPERPAHKWREMAVNLWKYLHGHDRNPLIEDTEDAILFRFAYLREPKRLAVSLYREIMEKEGGQC
jgi:hypothetical protein